MSEKQNNTTDGVFFKQIYVHFPLSEICEVVTTQLLSVTSGEPSQQGTAAEIKASSQRPWPLV